MNNSITKIITITVIVLLTPVLYLKTSTYSNLFIFMSLVNKINSNSFVMVAGLKTITNFISAFITAFLTVVPCVYLLPIYRKYISIVLTITILIFPVSTFFMLSHSDKLSVVDIVGQCISVIATIYYFATFGKDKSVRH